MRSYSERRKEPFEKDTHVQVSKTLILVVVVVVLLFCSSPPPSTPSVVISFITCLHPLFLQILPPLPS